MMTRRRSVPPRAKPPESSSEIPAGGSSTQPALVTPPSQPDSTSRLLAQADALSKMTYELNMRTVAKQAEHLEHDVRDLVMSTSEDKHFRQQHEQRLREMWKEVLQVKGQMSNIEGSQEDIKTGYERCQKEMSDTAELFRQEMGNLRGLVNSISVQLDQLPTWDEISQKYPGEESRHFSWTASEESQRWCKSNSQSQTSSGSSQSPALRIREAISSTRRWNQDHKNTSLSDAAFAARYFRQQSKRDPRLAVIIQKSVLKRIRGRLPRTRSQPESLEEFCKDVAWRDILETVEQVLVRDGVATAQTLR